jgi:hypothetical protein
MVNPSAVTDAQILKLSVENISSGILSIKPPVVEAAVLAAGKLLVVNDGKAVSLEDFIMIINGLVQCARPESSQPDIRRMAVVALKNIAKYNHSVSVPNSLLWLCF